MSLLPILPLTATEPLLAAQGLHALSYCPRLFHLQHVEGVRVSHELVNAGLELHASLAEAEDGEWAALELASERLGLLGKLDVLKRRDGVWTPYEHKRGRARRADDGSAEPWPGDRLQVLAYAALLEDQLGRDVPEGRVRYHAEGVTVRVPVDDAARADLAAALAEARRLRASLERPPVTDNERLCVKCSLAPVCLPEEGRLLRRERGSAHAGAPAGDSAGELDESADLPRSGPLIRLFPEDRDGATLHVAKHGASVGKAGEQLVVRPRDGDGPETRHPIAGLEAVVLHGFAQISTQAVHLCAEHGVAVQWMSFGGRHVAALTADVGRVQRRIRQYRALSDEATATRLTRALVLAKLGGQLGYLMRASRGDDNGELRGRLRPELTAIRSALAAVGSSDRSPDRDTLRGHEGAAGAAYFRGLRQLLNERVPEPLRFVVRNRRPPVDRFNAALGFGYGLLHAAVTRAVLAAGLEPALGFLHTPRSAAQPLVLDLMELFRVTLWDMPLVGSLNRSQWHPDDDFVVTSAKVWLSDAGRRKAIGLFESRLTETWKHPVLSYSLSYARTLELEARLLEKEWTGEPGLFARSIIR